MSPDHPLLSANIKIFYSQIQGFQFGASDVGGGNSNPPPTPHKDGWECVYDSKHVQDNLTNCKNI